MARTSMAGKELQPLTSTLVRSVARALEAILAEVQAGAAFGITRLTRVKRLCADQATALASDYVKRSNFSGFGDLNKESAEPLSEVVAFWYGYADTLAAGTGGARGQKEQP